MSARVLLTVSGTIAPGMADEVARGLRPRRDYFELARAFAADLIDVAGARVALGRFGDVLHRVGGPGLLLGWYCFRRRHAYDVIFTDGEQVGLPLAALFALGASRNRPRHLMIGHRMTAAKKAFLLDRFGLQRWIDQIFVYASSQQRTLIERWGLSEERAIYTPFMVDSRFFHPGAVQPRTGAKPLISSAGLEWRDYPTMMEAVRELDINVAIAAASPWSKRPDSTAEAEIPANVTVKRLSQYDLRQLYADSAFVVMPLAEVDFQAGVTAILEAMAMGKAVICSRTSGQTDVIVDGVNGMYVPSGDPIALRAAINHLLAHPDKAAQMGRVGRQLVEESQSLDRYTQRLATYVQAAGTTYQGKHSVTKGELAR
ncbi:MAG: glycosyltransferase family 4 protein [Oscillochloris sp.]|nr:glycosyltransferase family 4 protein [Oscillochloris sp.]